MFFRITLLFVFSFSLIHLQAQETSKEWYEKAQATKDPHKKIEYYTNAIKIKPRLAYAYYGRGLAYNKIKEYQKAIDDFSTTIKLKPIYANAYNSRGLAKMELEDLEDAKKDFTKAIDLKPTYALAYNYRGRVYTKQEKWSKAAKDYTKATQYKPNLFVAFNNLGYVQIQIGCYSKAVKNLGEAIRLNPRFYQAYTNRGQAHQYLRKFKSARADYNKALSIRPGYREAVSGLDFIRKDEITDDPYLRFYYAQTKELYDAEKNYEAPTFLLSIGFDSSHPITKAHFTFFINATKVEITDATITSRCEPTFGTLKVNLPLEIGQNTIKIVAKNNGGEDESNHLVINRTK